MRETHDSGNRNLSIIQYILDNQKMKTILVLKMSLKSLYQRVLKIELLKIGAIVTLTLAQNK